MLVRLMRYNHPERQRELKIMTSLSQSTSENVPHTDDDVAWTLTTDQMIFMLENHNIIEFAYSTNDLAALRHLSDSRRYKAVFGDMTWDEAFDRYETAAASTKATSSTAWAYDSPPSSAR
jgi:hypothetical protein